MSDLTPDPMTSYEAAEVAANIADADDIVDELLVLADLIASTAGDHQGERVGTLRCAAAEIVKLRAALRKVANGPHMIGHAPPRDHEWYASIALEALSDE